MFSVSALYFQIYTVKLIFTAKNRSDLCNFYSKLDFFEKTKNKKNKLFFLLFFTDFTDFQLLMFHNNIVKISEILNKRNLLIPASKLHVLSIFSSPEPKAQGELL